VEKKLLQTLDMVLVKKRRLAVTKRDTVVPSGGFWNLFSRSKSNYSIKIFYSWEITIYIPTGPSFLDIVTTLLDEIASLDELTRHLFLEVVELRNMEEREEWSKTWKGKYFNFLGYFFSLYCIWKIFIVRFNLFQIFTQLHEA